MSIALEEIPDTQFITNKSGEKTAIIVPLGEGESSFRKLLSEFIETQDYENANNLVVAERVIRELSAFLELIDDPEFLDEASKELGNLMELLEDKIDLLAVNKRKDEPSISHAELTETLRHEGKL